MLRQMGYHEIKLMLDFCFTNCGEAIQISLVIWTKALYFYTFKSAKFVMCSPGWGRRGTV